MVDLSVREKDTVKIPFTLFDETGAGIALASLDSLTIKVNEEQENTVVNGRNGVSIKNANGGVVDVSGGTGYWLMDPLDNSIVNAATPFGEEETHVLLFEFVYSTTKQGSIEYRIGVERVRNRA